MNQENAVKGMSGAEAILRVLRSMGVEQIFASPGSDWAPLWEALAKPYKPDEVPRYTSSRHEETAIGMAVGYAKATGKLPAVVLHTTVGALHATMALRAAMHERIPMVVLTGESASYAQPPAVDPGRQWLRVLADVGGPARQVEQCVKWCLAVNTPLLLASSVARACQLAMASPRGPTFLAIPVEMLMESVPADPPVPCAIPHPSACDPRALEELATALAAAKSPLIISEELGKNQEGVQHLVALAETLGAPVVDAWQPYYVNFPRAHPLYGGIVASSADMAALVNASDLVLLVDAVAPWHPPATLPGGATRIAIIGEDPLHVRLPVWNYPADLILSGDAGTALAALLTRVRQLVPIGSRDASIARWQGIHEARRRTARETCAAAGQKGMIESAWVGHELNAVLPPEAIVVDETITHRLDVQQALQHLEPGQFYEGCYGGLGLGLPIALGVKAAHPDRTVIVTVGDGAFHYNPVVASLGAAQEHRLPLLVILFNNAGYLSQKRDVMTEYPDGHAIRTQRFAGTSILPRPDYALLARAYGGFGERVESPKGLRAALARGLEAVGRGELALIDVVLAPVNPQDVR
jgi:acetolactate synthase-1/2/3 large subunit